MTQAFSVLIPFDRASAATSARAAAEAARTGAEVILAGEGEVRVPEGVRRVDAPGGRGVAVRHVIREIQRECTVLVEPWSGARADALRAVSEPVLADRADVVLPTWPTSDRPTLAEYVARELADLQVQRPLAPVRAFKTSALQGLKLISEGPGIAMEILVKLSAQSFRFHEVALDGHTFTGTPSRHEIRDQLATLFRYAFLANDADNQHEGYNTLERLEGAPRYNAWLGTKLRPHLGDRILEVGAGIGTITRQIAEGRERVIALEADHYYAQRLGNLFRGSPVVRTVHAPVEATDWARLGREGLDTVLLSNVLEHIEDDASAIRKFRSVLPPDGRLVILVPALPALFGTLDEAVGHHRRYTPETLRSVVEPNGFRIEHLEWLNLLGIAGWYLNGRILRRRVLPPIQLRIYDRVAPLLARAEEAWKLPIGLSLLAVGRAADMPGATA